MRETIRRVNRQSRDRFAEAFEAIRLSYQEIFKLLFDGGRADLRLEEGEDWQGALEAYQAAATGDWLSPDERRRIRRAVADLESEIEEAEEDEAE